MKRDWDLLRRILLTCEAATPGARIGPDAFEGVDRPTLFQHVKLLDEGGYVDARLMRYLDNTTGGGDFVILGLSWEGHDLLAKMASDTWWAKIKAFAADKGLALTFDVVKALAAPAAKSLLGLEEQ